MGMKYLIGYYVKTLADGKVSITNSFDKGITSDNYKELMDFLYTPYKQVDGRELKFFYNLDDSMAQIFRLMPATECKELLGMDFETAIKNNKYYYNAGRNFVIFGNHKVGNNLYRANFYSLDNLIQSEEEPKNAIEVYKLANRLLESLNRIGISFPLSMNSMISIFESSMGKIRLTPSTSFIPNEDIDLLTYARATSKRQGWVMNYKIGKFEKPYSYDLSSAYGYWLSQIRDFNNCEIRRYTPDYPYKDEICKGNVTGWFKTMLTINKDVKIHPFGYRDEATDRIVYPTDTFEIHLTLDEILYVYKNKLGSVKILDGFYVRFLTQLKPMEVWANRIFSWREKGELESQLCKALIVEYVGKVNSEKARSYNPLIASWVYAKCRLQVFDFIRKNQLEDSVIAITTDGVLSTKQALVTPINNGKKVMGTWRENKQSPALVLSSGWVITDNKKPHSFDYTTAIKLMQDSPNSNFYSLEYDRVSTLFHAVMVSQDMREVGKIIKGNSTINLIEIRYLQGKDYKEYPITGRDILSGKIYE